MSVYNIPADLNFAECLARGLLKRYAYQPLSLSNVTIYLPTQRAKRTLQDAFLNASQGQALLLPRLSALGDLDDEDLLAAPGEAEPGHAALAATSVDPSDQFEPWNEGARLLVAVKMLAPYSLMGNQGELLSMDQKLAMAQSLLQLLDQIETESLDLADLGGLVDDSDLAIHWQKSLEFLDLLSEVWPTLEAQFGRTSAKRLARLRAQAQIQAWRMKPPSGPILAAGTTASIPATRNLLQTISTLPNSEVLLPGLDPDTAACASTWRLIQRDPTHPQYGLSLLCKSLQVEPSQVAVWPDAQHLPRSRVRRAQVHLANWSALPSEATQPGTQKTSFRHQGWRQLPLTDDKHFDLASYGRALANIDLINCEDINHEAKVIALRLRATLLEPEATAALVTPNRDLARMVSAQLVRWGIAIDDSAGTPLSKSAAAKFILSVLDLCIEGAQPALVLDLIKNPLFDPRAIGADHASLTQLEQHALRSPAHGSTFAQLEAFLKRSYGQDEARRHLADIVRQLADKLAPLSESHRDKPHMLGAVKALVQVAQSLSKRADEGGEHLALWSAEAGTQISAMLSGLIEDESLASSLELTSQAFFRNLLDRLLARATLRQAYGTHPRLHILGTLEARLLNVDHVVLGGLVEGVFPAASEPGPWLSKGMRQRFGLPPLERKVGLTAHDFVQAMGNGRVTLTWPAKSSGAQTVPSRFLRRLKSYLSQLDAALELTDSPQSLLRQFEAPSDPTQNWAHWASQLDRKISVGADGFSPVFQPSKPGRPPRPNPMLSRRPKSFFATDIERWRANPYSLYARKVLKLRPWDPVGGAADVRMRGTLIHAACEAYILALDSAPPAQRSTSDLEALFEQLAEQQMDQLALEPQLKALWRPRIHHAGAWFVDEHNRRLTQGVTQVFVEAEGSASLSLENGQPLLLSARADRLELYPDGRLVAIDYKTGTPPSSADVYLGRKPQMAVVALLARIGRYGGVRLPGHGQWGDGDQVPEIEFWSLSGGRTPGAVKRISPPKDLEQSPAEALEDIHASLLEMFNGGLAKQTPFSATAAGYEDYHHLSRVQEWSGLDDSLTAILSRQRGGGR